MNIFLEHCFTFISGFKSSSRVRFVVSVSLDLCHPGQPNGQEQQHCRLNPNTHLLHYNSCLIPTPICCTTTAVCFTTPPPTLLHHPSTLLKDNCSVTVVNKSVDKVPKPEWRQWPPHKAHLTIFVGDGHLFVNVTMTKEQIVEWNQSERRHTVSVLMMQTKCLRVRLQKSVLLFDVGCLNSFDPIDQM